MASGESKGSRRYDKENLLWQSTVVIRSDPVAARKAIIHAVQSRECEDRRKDLEAKKEAEAKAKDNGGKVEAPAAKPMRLMERFGRTLARFGIPLPSIFTHSDNNFK